MCLAVPMKIIKVDGDEGIVEIDGVKRSVNISLLENVNKGDYVIVHAGFAIERLDPDYAKEVEEIWKELKPI